MEGVAVVRGEDGLSGTQEAGPVAGETGLQREIDWALGGLESCLKSSSFLPWEPEPVANSLLPLQPQWSHPPTLGCAVGAVALKTQSAESSAANVKPAHKKRGPRPRHFAKNSCQVDGCGADLSCASYYYQRNHICPEHLKQESIVVRGVPSRFCQRCGVSHDLPSFDGRKKSCRQALARHKQRRLTKLASGSFPELQSYVAEAGSPSLALSQPPAALAAPCPLQQPARGWGELAPPGLTAPSPVDSVPLSPQHACSTLGDSLLGDSLPSMHSTHSVLCQPSGGATASLGRQATLATHEDLSCASSMDLYALPDPPLNGQSLWGAQLPEDEDDLFSLLGLPSLCELDDLAAELVVSEQAGKRQEAVADSLEAACLAAGPLDGLPAPGSGDSMVSREEEAAPNIASSAAAPGEMKGTSLHPLLSPAMPQLPQLLAPPQLKGGIQQDQPPVQQQQLWRRRPQQTLPEQQAPTAPPASHQQRERPQQASHQQQERPQQASQQQKDPPERTPLSSPQHQHHHHHHHHHHQLLQQQQQQQQQAFYTLQVQLPGGGQLRPVGTTFTLQWAPPPAGMQAGSGMAPAWVLVPVPLPS